MAEAAGTVRHTAEAYRRSRGDAIGAELDPLAVVDDVATEYEAERASGRYTPIGLADRRGTLAEKAERTLAPYEADTECLRAELARLEDGGRPVEVSPTDTQLVATWFLGLSPDRQILEYHAAIENDDRRTVAIVENLPSSISPLTEAIRERARARKRERLPEEQRQRIETLRQRIEARNYGVFVARRRLDELR